MTERLEKRISLMEQKINPPKGSFGSLDIVGFVQEIRIESERLIQLSEDAYQMEMEKTPDSKVNQVARIGAKYQRWFNSLPYEEQMRLKGYIHWTPLEIEKAEAEKKQRATSPRNWFKNILVERATNSKYRL